MSLDASVGTGTQTLVFQATAPAGTQAITNSSVSGSTLTVNGATSSTSPYNNFTGNISNGASGTVALKVTNGYQELSGVNTYSGTATSTAYTQVTGGVLDALYTASLPGYSNSADISVSSGATLMLGVGGSGSFTSSNVDYIYNNVIPTGAYLGFDSSAATAAVSYATNITKAIGIVKWGTGLVSLTGSDSFTGAITVDGGTLAIAPASGTSVVGSTGKDVQVAPNKGDIGTLSIAAGATLNAGNIWVGYRDASQSGLGTGFIAQSGGLINATGELVLWRPGKRNLESIRRDVRRR